MALQGEASGPRSAYVSRFHGVLARQPAWHAVIDRLYSEPGVGGFWSVWHDNDTGGGVIDLEVLFNTIITRPDIYAALFADEGETV